MSTFIRESPSGPELEASSDTTDAVENTSGVPGATFTDALDDLEEQISELESVQIVDDLLGGAEATTTINDPGRFGDLGMSFFATAGGTLARASDHSNYFGAYAITAAASGRACLWLNNTAGVTGSGTGVSLPSALYTFVELLGTPDTADSPGAFGQYRYGLGSVPTDVGFGSAGIYLEVNRAVSNNWRLVGRVSGVNNVSQTAVVPYTPHALARLRLERDSGSGSWSGYVNDVLVGTLTSAQVSATRMSVGAQVEATAASSQQLSLDRISYATTALTLE